MAYGRFDKQGTCVIAVNNREEATTQTISVWELGIPMEAKLTRLILSTADDFSVKEEEVLVRNGKITLEMSKTSAIVLKYKKI